MLVIPVLLLILFLAGGALTLGKAWMGNAYNAENDVYGQVVAGRNVTVSQNNVPVDGINAIRPALPNRYDFADEMKVVTMDVKGVPPVPLEDQAIMLDPAWHWSCWPQMVDRPVLQEWFTAYVGESHPAEVVEALGLREAGPP